MRRLLSDASVFPKKRRVKSARKKQPNINLYQVFCAYLHWYTLYCLENSGNFSVIPVIFVSSARQKKIRQEKENGRNHCKEKDRRR